MENIALALVCNKGFRCHPDILANTNNTVVSSRFFWAIINTKGYRANPVFIERSIAILALLRADRYHYAIYPVNQQFQEELQK